MPSASSIGCMGKGFGSGVERSSVFEFQLALKVETPSSFPLLLRTYFIRVHILLYKGKIEEQK